MRLPKARHAVAIFALLLVIGSAYRQYWMDGNTTIWPSEAFALAQMFIPVSLFVAAFVIDNRWALILPLVGYVGQTLLNHGIDLYRGGPAAQALEQVHLRSELWDALTTEVVTGTVIVAVALSLAAWWWPLADDLTVTEYEFPDIRFPAMAFAAFFAAQFAYDLIFVDLIHTAVWEYGQQQLSALLSDGVTISFFVLVVCAYSPWVLPVPIFMTTASLITVVLQPAFTCDGGCASFVWSVTKWGLLLLVAFMLIAFAAGWWTRTLSRKSGAGRKLAIKSNGTEAEQNDGELDLGR